MWIVFVIGTIIRFAIGVFKLLVEVARSMGRG